MVDHKSKRNPMARWVLETGRRFQEGRQARRTGNGRSPEGHNRRRFLRRPPAPPPGWGRWFLAWGVHAYTSLSLVAAAIVAVLIVRGDATAFQGCFALMIIATLVDATDGTLARKVGVKQVLPGFDGRRLDDIADFLMYSFLPLFLVWRAEILPTGWEAWLLVPLLASAYGFCQVSIKTDDGYFLGFPSLWNVVAFYVYTLRFPDFVNLAVMIVLGILTFVPSRYLYPSSSPCRLNRWSNILGALWAAMLLYIVWQMPAVLDPTDKPIVRWVVWASLLYPIFYLTASWIITLRFWKGRRMTV